MHPELEEYCRQLSALQCEFDVLADFFNEEDFNWSPAPEVWSIGQNISHLNLTLQHYLSTLRQATEKGRREGRFSPGPFPARWLERKLLALVEPPVRWKVRASCGEQPDSLLIPKATMNEFHRLRQDLANVMAEADGLDLRGIRVRGPRSRLLQLGLGKAFALMLAHDRRHLAQAQSVVPTLLALTDHETVNNR